MKDALVIGSRGSKLALTQAGMVKTALEALNPAIEVRLEIIKTSGDVKTDPLSVIGGKGVFTKELEEALLDGRIDVAVHSLKDLPTIIPETLQLAAICEREDARDALVIRADIFKAFQAFDTLPGGAVVGTSSPRRLAQLKHLRQDLVIKDLRGNVDTRLAKLDAGHYDALILASAGLRRLKLDGRISVLLRPQQMLPAPGQGALGIETRANDSWTINLVAPLNHPATSCACTAERAFLRALGGGCQLPIAAYAKVHDRHLSLDGLVADTDGTRIVRDRVSGGLDQAEELGGRLGEQLLASGACELLASEAGSSEYKL
jgi:hydroxymethylbilane synthase